MSWSEQTTRLGGRWACRALLAISPSLVLSCELRAAPPDYDRDIRPILSDRCFFCHGPDPSRREADLRLDTFEGLTEYVVVPGKPDESELVTRVTSDDPEYVMPPPASHLKLTAKEKELLNAWIADGAKVTEHWAFRPLPAEVALPNVKDERWPRSALDRFVLARLDAEELGPSSEAAPLRLLRRLSFDLTGLPPTVEEIAAFEKRAAENPQAAIEEAVERLLASPAYGEHFATAWLDAARYADSFGYQSDQLNTQWPYRDWVVRALNDNKRYDEFLTDQIAGDLRPSATRDQVLATAFNRLHRMTNEGGSLAEEWLVENASDRIHTLGTAVLGLTVECARCHDHKYDPITQRDYYALSAFFNSIDENGMYDRADKVPSPSLLLPTKEQQRQLDAACDDVSAAEESLASARAQGVGRFRAWLESGPEKPVLSDLVGRASFDADDKQRFEGNDRGAKLDSDDPLPHTPGVKGEAITFDGDRGVTLPKLIEIDRWQPFTLDLWVRDAARNPLPVVIAQQCTGTDVGFNGFDLMLADGILEARLYRVWPGNAIGVRACRPITADEWQHIAVSYDGSSRAAGLKLYLNGVALPVTILRDKMLKSTNGGDRLTLGQRFRDRGFQEGSIDELRIFRRALTPLEIAELHNRGEIVSAMKSPTEHKAELREFYSSAVDEECRQLADELRDARQRFVSRENEIHEVSVMGELPEPRPAYVLARGSYEAPKNDDNHVGRDTFAEMLIPFPDDAPRDRLGLAEWLTDPAHPLTARVFVNRVWANFFGRGLVSTPENFGRQGAAPSHPELLDWLSRDFISHGWDMKRLCRQIALSATYQQDSQLRPELLERDPENILLARGPSRRLAAEGIRDLALAASGLLDATTGGPPVSPYQPGGDLWREVNAMSPAYKQSTGKALHRRSLYSVWKRTAPLPNMLAFDAGTREVCTVARSRTNTPLQALVLLNDIQFIEAARSLAAYGSRRHDNLREQIVEAFSRCTGRQPDELELNLLVDVYKEQQALFAENKEQDAEKFLRIGEAKTETSLTPANFAALTATCQTILNLDATIYER
jgi:hypothetical protein